MSTPSVVRSEARDEKRKTMKAIVYSKYGSPDVLSLDDIDQPVAKDNEVLVRVRAAAANPADWHMMRGDPYLVQLVSGLRKPRHLMVLGSDVAGEVVAVGKNVSRFRPGDEVFAETMTGGFAEYIAVPEDILGPKPVNLTHEQAAAVPMAANTALQALRDRGRVGAGQRVLINGASGGVGTFAVQIAKFYGAEVTGVCSGGNVDLVRSIGADQVIDYTSEDFTAGKQRYDLIVDTVSNHSLAQIRRVLTPKGSFVPVGAGGGRWLGPGGYMLRALLLSPFVSQTMAPVREKPNAADLQVLKELVEAGHVTPVIDRTYPLDQAADAVRYLEEGHVRGKVVISI
jgi:NADPH:quinone reductase-like Zn-dependent oxidoreductase